MATFAIAQKKKKKEKKQQLSILSYRAELKKVYISQRVPSQVTMYNVANVGESFIQK